jgi:O-antigen/teichoic acid export membrane protein
MINLNVILSATAAMLCLVITLQLMHFSAERRGTRYRFALSLLAYLEAAATLSLGAVLALWPAQVLPCLTVLLLLLAINLRLCRNNIGKIIGH